MTKAGPRADPDADLGEGRDASGIQSVEIGMAVLAAVARQSSPTSLANLARACDMARTKAFRYLNSLERTRYVEREPGTGRYRLGASSVQLGLAALAGTDFARIGSEWLPAICRDLDETVFLTVWGQHGATIVRWEETGRPIAVNVRVGSTMPLLRSATGRLFGAYLPEAATSEILEAELATGEGRTVGVDAAAEAASMFAAVREAGLGRVQGSLLPSLGALALPVFDGVGKLAGTITALGLLGVFDDTAEGHTARTLRSWTERLSYRLGYSGSVDDRNAPAAVEEPRGVELDSAAPRGFDLAHAAPRPA